MKTKEIIELYIALKSCDINKINDNLKVKTVCQLVKLQPSIDAFEKRREAAIEHLKDDEKYPLMYENRRKWKEFEKAEEEAKKADKSFELSFPLTEEEKNDTRLFFINFDKKLNEILEKSSSEENVKIDAFTEEEYLQLINSREMSNDTLIILFRLIKKK